jgi:phosphatidylglycerol:prolipoprotein diacylglycerol transferase
MYTEISFPALGITLNPSTGFSVFGIEIRWYGVIIAFGLLLAVIYAMRRCKQFGFTQDDLIDGLLVTLPIAIIGARIYYCAFNWSVFADNPISVLYIHQGGIAIYGSIIGAVIGILIIAKWKKINIFSILDLTSLGFLIGQFVGRWGNFMNREAFGEETASFLRMGLLNPETGIVTYYHPTFLYESLWNFAGFLMLNAYYKRRKFDGEVALLYTAWYGLGRAFIEGLRTDSLYIGATGIRVSQVLAAVSCVLAVALLVWLRFLRKKPLPELFVNRAATQKSTDLENR